MRTLIVGSGFVGQAVASHIVATGGEAILASRNPPAPTGAGPAPKWTRLDATDGVACGDVVAATSPDTLLLVHGPSDATWCEANPSIAADLHERAAGNLAAAAAGRRVVLISSDNVFDGRAEANGESAPPRPANAYGAAKLRAEQSLLRHADDAVVLRVSLVYGWEPAATQKWLNFFSACAHQLLAGLPVSAPDDQWTTPVLVDDVARVTAAVLRGGAPTLLHLAGPDRISRADWARLIARQIGADEELVRAVPRAGSRYASRPANSCLISERMARHASTAGLAIRGVAEGAAFLLHDLHRTKGTP